LREVAAVERQFGDLAAFHHITNCGIGWIDDWRASFDCDGLRDVANVEAEVGDANLPDLKFGLARDFFEALLRDLNPVTPGW